MKQKMKRISSILLTFAMALPVALIAQAPEASKSSEIARDDNTQSAWSTQSILSTQSARNTESADTLMLKSMDDPTYMKSRAFQIGFVTPLGSNGINSGSISNNVSVNLLAGYAGGIDGVEFSGLGSVLKGNMTGAQFAGLGNIVLRETKGAQFSGLFSIGLGKTKAAQFSGLLNIGLDTIKAAQFAGLLNMGMDEVKGAQFAGLANINTGKTKGFQASGFTNINTDTTIGLQITGAVNYAHGNKVSQVGGFVNITEGDNKGFQLAGFMNINTCRHSGTQVAGFLNYAKKLKGVQIGVFNYVDSLENGTPVGFLSFVKNGYSTFEIGSTETLYGVMSFKTGTKKFYNILSVGGGYREGFSLFAWGYGLGAFIPVSNKIGLSIDGICYQVNEGEWFTKRLNLLNKLNLNVSWLIAKHLSVYGGLSWNVTVSDITDDYGDPVDAHIAPFSLFNEIYEDHLEVKMYPGISAGIRL
jgi:hypothetical protein